MVDNIVLSTLTGPSLQKGVSPLISTKDGERDGTRGGGGGGGEPPSGELYNMSNLTYLGAFSLGPKGSHEINKRIGFRPPNGSNGTWGSIFQSDSYYEGYAQPKVREVQIPENLSSETVYSNLPQATVLQDWINIQTETSAGTGTTSLPYYPNGQIDRLGYMREINGKLHVASYTIYNGDSSFNNESLVIFDDPSDLSTSTSTGWTYTTVGDYGVEYCNPIPAEHQSLLGGSWLIGASQAGSIQNRWSQGPSLHVINPDDPTPFTASTKLLYPYSDPSTGQYINLAKPEFPWQSYMGSWSPIDNWNQAILHHYITDTLGYVYTTDNLTPTGYNQYIESGATPAFETLPPPPQSAINDLWSGLSTCCNAFIVPGTKTVMCIGTVSGITWGGGYKAYYRDGNNKASGNTAIDRDDHHHWYWLYNLDDILSATNLYDPKPYDRGVFDTRFQISVFDIIPTPSSDDRKFGREIGGFFDIDTGRLYCSVGPMPDGSHVCTVYQVV